jgi:hypothetical protein
MQQPFEVQQFKDFDRIKFTELYKVLFTASRSTSSFSGDRHRLAQVYLCHLS